MASKTSTTKTILIASASLLTIGGLAFLFYRMNKNKKAQKKELDDLKSQLSESQKKEQVSQTIKEVKSNPAFIRPIKVM